MRSVRPSLAAVAALALAAGSACAAAPRARTPASAPVHARASDASTFNFADADVAAVAGAMSQVLGREILVDPRVKGKLTLATDQPIAPAHAFALFTAALRGQGAALVETNGVLEVVPESDAKLMSAAVFTQAPGPSREGDAVVTQVLRLQHESAANLVPTLRPLITANNTITVSPGGNALVVTDYASNLARIAAIVAALDVPPATDVEVIALQHALAADIAPTVLRLSEGGGAAGNSPGASGAATTSAAAAAGPTSVIADPHLNALLVRAPNPARLAAIRALVARLDVAGAGGTGTGSVHVIYLQHADATRLASVLRAALPAVEALQGGTAGGGGGSGAASADSSSPLSRGGASSASGSTSASGSSTSTAGSTPIAAIAAPSIGGYIQADPASNALIVTAPEPVFRDIRAVVDELDVRRAQVYVESLVVEVDASRALDVGLQWKQLFNISESTVLTLGTVATALETITGTNILSTANLVTLDNEEAKIVVGQNVPFVTGSYATTSSSSTVNPFQTIERKDVGVTLRIRPQIGRNGVIRMAILQESSSVASTSETSGPTTNTRSIETNVAVRDGRIVVLGGLIEDSDTRETDAVPVVSRIPLLGNLFRSLTRTRRKTNLLVFLRPVVMPDDGAADGVTLDRYDRIRARQAALPDDTRRILDGVAAPALPAPPAPEAASARGSSFDPAVPVPASVPAAQ